MNRHPIDALADCRQRIKLLKIEESQLRSGILKDRSDLVGDDFEAKIADSKIQRVDLVALRREMGLRFLRPFMKPAVVTRIQIKRIRKRGKRPTRFDEAAR